MAAKVVFAMQSPTLLNILAKSHKWDLSVADLGDSQGLAEAQLAEAPQWDGRADGVEAVFVCSPDQERNAHIIFPRSKIVWVAHNGRCEILDLPTSECDHYLTFSYRVKHMVEAHVPSANVQAIVPYFKAQPVWDWVSDTSWTFRNRPSTRQPDVDEMMTRVFELTRRYKLESHLVYGQDQALGFATEATKEMLHRCSSCYLSTLPRWAGFGLAEHEAMAAGVPLVALSWGDFDNGEHKVQGIRNSLQSVANYLIISRMYRGEAIQMSMSGLDFIDQRRSMRRMECCIETLLDSLRS